MAPEERAVGAYAVQGHDRMREALETGFFARLLPGRSGCTRSSGPD